ncbi:MAG: cupredoxin domain-containing protein [Thermoleophilaceae bacterium]|nr:cupredoxin domain-containing protein [Thermoleophilaceae bacterium]
MRWPWAASVGCLATLAGCGADGDRPVRTLKVPAGDPIRVTAESYRFDPGRIQVMGAGPLRFTLMNRGDLAHNLQVLDGERELGGVKSFPSGQARTFRVVVPPGSYSFVCTVADHRELGMEGELRVGPQG